MADSHPSDWFTTASNNTSVGGGVNIAENCPMAGMNNAHRAEMAGVKGAFLAQTASGGDTYTATLAPVPGTYTTGYVYFANFATANTSSTATINFNSLGNKTLTLADGSALSPGVVNGPLGMQYDGAKMRLMVPNFGVPTGTMLDFAASTAPAGFLACDGTTVSRTTYSALFAVIGTTWGSGDGSTTFTLPDFKRRVAVGSGGTGTSTLANSVGSTGGSETHTQTVAEMPSHTHGVNDSGHTHAIDTGTGATGTSKDAAAGDGGGGRTSHNATTGITIQSTGSGTAFNIMQPSAVVLKIIKT